VLVGVLRLRDLLDVGGGGGRDVVVLPGGSARLTVAVTVTQVSLASASKSELSSTFILTGKASAAQQAIASRAT